jgi:cysteine synthase B
VTSGSRRERAAELLDKIGRTPLIELDPFPEAPETRVFAKLESCNPGGSIKDRPVARMLTRAIDEGQLEGGRRVLDSSSGNAGIAYAMLGAALGVPITLVVPGNASRERLDRIRAHGAELILTDPIEGYDFALREAARLAREQEDRYWHCNQYANEHNWRAHYEGTGVELLAEITDRTGNCPDAFVCGVGTGGTLTGVGRRLREANAGLRIAAVIPEIFPGIEGLKPLGDPGDIVPAILDEGLIDERFDVTLEEAALEVRELARQGLFVGPSSGAYVVGVRRLIQRGGLACVATVLSDTGERYTSTGLWGSSVGVLPSND